MGAQEQHVFHFRPGSALPHSYPRIHNLQYKSWVLVPPPRQERLRTYCRWQRAAKAGLHNGRSEEHTSELQSPCNLVCRLLLEKKQTQTYRISLPLHALLSLASSSTPHTTTQKLKLNLANILMISFPRPASLFLFFFLNDTPPTEFYPLPPRAALPI